MPIDLVTAQEAQRLISQEGAILVDIREPHEHAREHIAGAVLAPVSQGILDEVALPAGGTPVIFHCASGNRTRQHALRLERAGARKAYVLEGGLAAWKVAGLPTVIGRHQPIEMQRQVQIVAGTLVVLGLVLAGTVSEGFAAISAFAGLGLVYAGVSGSCAMARLLSRMPWNQRLAG